MEKIFHQTPLSIKTPDTESRSPSSSTPCRAPFGKSAQRIHQVSGCHISDTRHDSRTEPHAEVLTIIEHGDALQFSEGSDVKNAAARFRKDKDQVEIAVRRRSKSH